MAQGCEPGLSGKSVAAKADISAKAQQDLLKANYPDFYSNSTFGVTPQTPRGGTSGKLHSPDGSSNPREIPLSAVRSGAHPLSGDPADPQKLAASWVTNQQFGDAAERVSSWLSGPAWAQGGWGCVRSCKQIYSNCAC